MAGRMKAGDLLSRANAHAAEEAASRSGEGRAV